MVDATVRNTTVFLAQVIPHGIRFDGQRNVLGLRVVCDGFIAVAYFAIALTLVLFAGRRRDLPFKWLVSMFAAFLVVCAITHAIAIWVLWHPEYWADVAVKACTALIAVGTATVLVAVMPRALALRSPKDLEALNHRLEMQSAEMKTIIDNVGDGVVVFNEKLEILRANSEAMRFVELCERYPGEVVDGHGVAVPKERWPSELARASGEAQINVITRVGDEANRRWVATNATPLSILGGSAAFDRIVLSLRDVTEMKLRETEQRDYAQQLHALHAIASMTTANRKEQVDAALLVCLAPLGLDRALLGTLDVATHQLVIECSVALEGQANVIAVGRRFPLGKTLAGRVMELKDVVVILDVDAEGYVSALPPEERGKSFIGAPVFVNGSAYGAITFFGQSARTAPFTQQNVEFVKLVGGLIGSAVARALQSERLDALAFFDALTGLPNRVLLYDRLLQTIHSSQRRGERFAVLFLDLDGFKSINDGFGHTAGDTVLKVMAARLQGALRDGDTVARLGGDEFVIVATGVATILDAAHFAERVLHVVRQPIPDAGRTYRLTASIGISFYPVDGNEVKTLIEQADVALYRAKNAGKNQVYFAMEKTSAH